MQGFLTDGVRDVLTIVGFALAIVQTWLAIKTTRAGTEEPTNIAEPTSHYPTSLKVASVGLVASLLFLVVGAGLVLWQVGVPTPTAADNLRQITKVQRIAFTFVSLWAVGYVVAGIAVQNWQESGTESPRGGRALALLTVWSVPVVTLCAVIAVAWAFGKIEDRVIPNAAVAAAHAFALWTIGWDTGLVLIAVSVAMPGRPA